MRPDQTPFTLRSAAGAPQEPPSLADSLVVVIDAQVEYSPAGRLSLPHLSPSLERLSQLLTAARSAGATVVHVVHHGQPGGLFDPEAGGQILDKVQPLASETVIAKSLPNAFANTGLLHHVEQRGNPPLVLAGYMTHMCISSTARAALDLGLSTTVVSDATATRALPSATNENPLTADHLHQAALAALADRFSIVTDTASLVS